VQPGATVALSDEYKGEFTFQSSAEVARDANVSGNFLHVDMRSHVFLAACGEDQLAFEKGGQIGNGLFTAALLALLEKRGADILTCAHIITAVGPLAQ
jgi:hypothetical protein